VNTAAPADGIVRSVGVGQGVVVQRQAPIWQSPWLWLALALVTGIVALGMQRRLRKAG